MSHIPIDFGRAFDIEFFSPPITTSILVCERRLLPRKLSLLVNKSRTSG